MSAVCYRPTPLERAHAAHLLLTYFNTPVDLYNDDGEIRVSGRDAVPFLTSSGVDRSLLRSIWSVADPEGVGTLTIRSQFYTILRLIAMAQAHFLPPLPSTPGTENQHTSPLKEALSNNSHLIMALPTFSSDPDPPTVAHLLGKYPSPSSHLESMGNSPSAGEETSNNIDVSNMLVNHDLQYQMWQRQQQQMGVGGNTAWGSAVAPVQMSVDDAFGNMSEVEDRPLPSLQYTMPEEEADNRAIQNKVDDEDGFGDFDAAQTEDTQKKPSSVANGAENEFCGFGEMTNSFQQHDPSSFHQTLNASDNRAVETEAMVSADDFNTFDAARANNDTTNMSTFQVMQQTNVGGFNSATNETNLPDKEDVGQSESTDPHVDHMDDKLFSHEVSTDHNAGDTSQDEAFGMGCQSNPTMSISDAFEGLIPENDVGGFDSTNHVPTSMVREPRVLSQEHVVSEDDRLNGFEGVDAPSEFGERNIFLKDTPATSSLNDNHGPTLSISNAFESLSPDQHFPIVSSDQAVECSVINEDGSFGGFESKEKIQNEVNDMHDANIEHNGDDFGDFESNSAEHNGHNKQTTLNAGKMELAGAYDSENTITQVDIHVLPLSVPGDFESLVHGNDVAAMEGNLDDATFTPEGTYPDEIQNMESFGSIDPVHSSQVLRAGEKKTSNQSNSTTEAFYQVSNQPRKALEPTFENAEFNRNTENENFQSGGLSAFDVFGDIQDAPLPPLEEFSSTLDQGVNTTFEAKAANKDCCSELDIVKNGASVEDGTGAFSDEAQSMEHMQSPKVTDESFGDFVESTIVAVEMSADNENDHVLESIHPAQDKVSDKKIPHETQAQPSKTSEIQLEISGGSLSDLRGFAVIDHFSPKPEALPEEKTIGQASNIPTPTIEASDFGDLSAFSEASPRFDELPAQQTETQGRHPPTDEEFAPFEEAPSATDGHAKLETTNQTPQHNNGQDNSGFYLFDSAHVKDRANKPTHTAADISAEADDDFGDFTAFGSVEAAEDSNPDTQIAAPIKDEGMAKFSTVDTDYPSENRSDCFPGVPSANGDFPGFSDLESSDAPTDVIGQTENAAHALHEDVGVLESTNVDDTIIHSESQEEDDGFGDFAAFGSAKGGRIEEVELNHTVADLSAEADDDFGDFTAFGSVEAAEDSNPDTQIAAPIKDEGMAKFSAVDTDYPSENRSDCFPGVLSANGDFLGFSDLESSDAPTGVIVQTEDAAHALHEDVGVLESTNVDDTIIHSESQEEDDGFGDFAAFGSAEVEDGRVQDVEPNTFSQHNECEVSNEAAAFEVEDDFGDFAFAKFDSAPPPTKDVNTASSHPYDDLRGKICTISELPASLPSKATIIEYFDRCHNREQLTRCVLLCEMLTKRPDLPVQWENAISFIKGDIERGQQMLDFFSVKLSSKDRSMMLRCDRLSYHFLGLAEFVRLARYIEASLSDILCLDTGRTESCEYNESKFMASFKSIEKTWNDVLSRALDVGILVEAPSLTSVNEIRARYINSESCELCQFTLQPLSSDQNQGTSSNVTWNGEEYMACAANFLVNRLLSSQATF